MVLAAALKDFCFHGRMASNILICSFEGALMNPKSLAHTTKLLTNGIIFGAMLGLGYAAAGYTHFPWDHFKKIAPIGFLILFVYVMLTSPNPFEKPHG